MAMIPAEQVYQMQQQPYTPIAPAINQLSLLDQQMKSILDNEHIPPELKLQQYHNNLRRFGHIQDDAFRVPVPVKLDREQAELFTPKTKETGDLPVSEHDIMERIPQAQRRNAKLLLEHIRHNPSLRWNDRKELVYNGQRVPNSNFYDLVLDISQNRKQEPPAHGWKEFTEALVSQNIPAGAIGNTYRRQQIRHYMNQLSETPPRLARRIMEEEEEDEGEDPFKTPARRQSARLQKKKRGQRGGGVVWERLY